MPGLANGWHGSSANWATWPGKYQAKFRFCWNKSPVTKVTNNNFLKNLLNFVM
jgi:hypothetical protein